MGAAKKPAGKTPAFRTDFPRFTRVLMWVNLSCLLFVLIWGFLDLWQGQGVEALKKLPVLLGFVINAWMNWQALKHKN